jgi:hypothetical protein
MLMPVAQDSRTKVDLLRRYGYKFNIERVAFVNRETRKVFSQEFVDAHDESEIEKCIRSPAARPGWTFFFNDPPTDSLRAVLEDFFNNGRRLER